MYKYYEYKKNIIQRNHYIVNPVLCDGKRNVTGVIHHCTDGTKVDKARNM